MLSHRPSDRPKAAEISNYVADELAQMERDLR
jgi:hypothetical protein